MNTSIDNSLTGKLFSRLGQRQAWLMVLVLIVATAISASWLVFPYLVQGQKLLVNIGGGVKQEQRANAVTLGRFLTRVAPGPGEADVDVLYATPLYFEKMGKARVVSLYRPDKYIIFVVTETTHTSDLPAELPQATLSVDGVEYQPAFVEGPLDIVHHRVTTIRFDAFDDNGKAILQGAQDKLRLTVSSAWDPDRTPRSVEWALPLQYPQQLLEAQQWTPLMVFGLSAGLLSFVLTPCLLQLLVVYIVTVTGLSVDQVTQGNSNLPANAGRRMFLIALMFVTAFSVLFTLAGAAIGYAAKEMQLFFAEWSTLFSTLTGLLVIGLGIWIGVRSRAPLVCKLIKLPTATNNGRGGYLSSALMAIGFSMGCLTCFGGAIIATLLIYVGSIGSASVGAMVMFTFSLGVVIPFLLGALFLSKVMPLMTRLNRYAPYIGFVSMLIIIGFGIVLVTDNFHVLSDLIYPYLGLR